LEFEFSFDFGFDFDFSQVSAKFQFTQSPVQIVDQWATFGAQLVAVFVFVSAFVSGFVCGISGGALGGPWGECGSSQLICGFLFGRFGGADLIWQASQWQVAKWGQWWGFG